VTRGIEAAGPHAPKCVHAGNCKEVSPTDIDIPQVIQGKEEVPENCLVETYEVVCASSFSCFSISSKAFWTSFSISSMGFGGGVVASA
jgi:L-lactate utilization protein LutB